MEPLPNYVEGQIPQSAFDALLTRIVPRINHPDARVVLESFVESQRAPGYNGPDDAPEPPKPIEKYPDYNPDTDYTLMLVKRAIVAEFFNAISREDNESIALLVQHNIVSANTRNQKGETPLLTAILLKSFPTVKQLLDLGADPNAFGDVRIDHLHPQEIRTPLMLAAKLGSLPLVKLLFEHPYSADDSLVAPDGQIALRLAADNGHRPIVEYLPSRRGGSFLRFKAHNAQNIARAKKALYKIYYFIRIFVWDIPKFFVWTLPKELVVLPFVKMCKWSWENRKKFGGWCKRQLTEVPKRVWAGIKKVPEGMANAAKRVWAGIKKVPEGMANAAKEVWKFGTKTLPRWLKDIAVWFWELLTKRIPKAIVVALKWVWDGLKSSGQAIWRALLGVASFLHTLLQGLITFLKSVTLKDIWNSFCDLLSSIFITFPKTLWSWTKSLSTASFKFMTALLGELGEVLWWIGAGLFYVVTYLPKKIWVIVQSIGNSMSKGAHEVLVFVNPKA